MADTNGTSFTSVEDTHVPALDGDSNDGGQTALEGSDNTADQGAGVQNDQQSQDGQESASGSGADTRDSLMEQFAKEHELDLSNPRDKKVAQRLADKELMIRSQKSAAAKGSGGQQQPGSEEDGLTEFERSLRGQTDANDGKKADEEQKPGTTQPQQTTNQTENKGPQVGDNWKTPSDYLTELNEAWSKNDLNRVDLIETVAFNRRFDSLIAPKIEGYVQHRLEQFMKEQLGDVVPHVRQTVQEQRTAAAVDFAVKELAKTKGFEDIAKLDDELEGPPIKFNGQDFRNTPMNRVIAENPWILSIQEKHANPETAMRLTNLARYRAAFKIYSGQQVPADKAKQLMEAGKQQQDRQQQDRTRQSLNGGRGAGTSLTQGKGKAGSYVDELLSGDGEPTSFASL